MNFALDDEQRRLSTTAREFLADHAPSAAVRAAMESERGWDPAFWQRLAGEMGWPAVIVPEAYGGLGLGQVELMVLMEAMGATLACAPFFSTVCLAANALMLAGSEAHRTEWLAAIAAGTATATVAHAEANGRWDADGIAAIARPEGDDFVVSGTKTYVVDGHTADLLIVAARHPGSRGADGVSLFALPATTPGLTRRVLGTMDQTRKLAEIGLENVRVPASALMGPAGAAWPALATTLQLATVALAAEQVGGAERCLDLAVAYAKERVQFGRPIGSFQAIKHKCADMLTRVEAARSASYYAACIAAERGARNTAERGAGNTAERGAGNTAERGAGNTAERGAGNTAERGAGNTAEHAAPTSAEDGAALPIAASLAKAYCSDAYFQCAADCLQIHGGVGFTWEYDVHLYFKRAKSSESLLGDAAYHRERVAQMLGL